MLMQLGDLFWST